MTATFAGVSLDRPRLMGIVNVTPDSFYDGGTHSDAGAAIAHGRHLVADGADILDVGGESTRPGAEAIPVAEELRRVIPVILGLADCEVPISIDTRRAEVMRQAAAAGATVVNDVTALTGDPDSLGTVAALGVSVVLMHMLGEPRTMQDAPEYDDVTAVVREYLDHRVAACEGVHIPRNKIAVDPGIGFGKTLEHNLALLAGLKSIAGLGCPVVLGVSRKSFIGHLGFGDGPEDRLPGSLAAALAGVRRGAAILRVHDVAATRQFLDTWAAVEDAARA